MQKTLSVLFLASTLLFASSGCSGKPSSPGDPAAARKTVTLFAAASTAPALEEIVAVFNRRHGFKVETNFAGSSTLAQQIASGAGADVFVSANEAWMDFLEEKGLVAGRVDLLGNRLVIVLPEDPPVEVRGPEDLLDDEIHHVALAETEGVPAGIYAREALVTLGLWDRLESKVVAAADVRQALAYVETGAAEAGIVYATDAASSDGVTVAVEIDPALTDPIRYPAALLSGTANPQEAAVLFDFLVSPAALDVFRKNGFTVLKDPPL